MAVRGANAKGPTEEQIVAAGLDAVRTALKVIHEGIHERTNFHLLWNAELRKYLYVIDMFAEKAGRDVLKAKLNGDIHLLGEETGEDMPAGMREDRLIGLLDMLDGSDLLARNLGNWCSALTLYRRTKIVNAVVGLENSDVYFTRSSRSGAFVETQPKNSTTRTIVKLKVDPKSVAIRDASIAFYGQKPGNLLSIISKRSLRKSLKAIAAEAKDNRDTADVPKLRLYNLGGNPIMMSLIEGKIDGIIELQGQQCHDVVPGFVIALKAGAVIRDLENQDIDEKRILEKLRNPKDRFKYVMARDKKLATELVDWASGLVQKR